MEKSLRIWKGTLMQLLLHMGLLNLSLWMGIPKPLAPIPVFAIAIPVNFLLVRFVSKKRVIICFSPDFLRILQKDLFYDGKLSHTRRCRTLLQKEEAVLHETHKRLSQLFDRLIQARQISPESYILYVNDGSTDQTWAIIKELHRKYGLCLALNLAGNVGHQNALLAGLNARALRDSHLH